MKLRPPQCEWRETPFRERVADFEDAQASSESASDERPFLSLQFVANGVVLWDVDFFEGTLGDARARACSEMAAQAVSLGVQNFDSFVRALAQKLAWTQDQARALAIGFVFPGALFARERFPPVWVAPRRRGRPTKVDRSAWVLKLVNVWKALTGNDPGVSNAHFLKAFEVTVSHLGTLSRKDKPLVELEKFLEQERKKLTSEHFEWSSPFREDEPSVRDAAAFLESVDPPRN